MSLISLDWECRFGDQLDLVKEDVDRLGLQADSEMQE